MLIDAGVLIALLDVKDPNHNRCQNAARNLPNIPMYTTWCCFTEAMYFMGKIGGYRAQRRLWTLQQSGKIRLHIPNETRMAALMEQYQDTPMDLADASLVVTAEELQMLEIFTLDSDFYVYRTNTGLAFVCTP
jgi:uncharacterized protein